MFGKGEAVVQRHKIGLATVSLHISAGLYVIVGLLLIPLFMYEDETGHGLPFAVLTLLLCLALASGIEFVVCGLHRRKF